MSRKSRAARACAGLLCCVAAACAADADKPVAMYEESGQTQKASCPSTLPPFATGEHGLTVVDPESGVSARLDDADFFPPDKTYNTWVIALSDADGAPASAATLSWACAYMPLHGHGSNPKAINVQGDGVFELERQNLSMYGPWVLQLWVDPAGANPNYEPQHGNAVANGHECAPTNGAPARPNLTLDFCVPEDRGAP